MQKSPANDPRELDARAATTIEKLKSSSDNLWRDLKSIESVDGDLLNNTGKMLEERIKEYNPDLKLKEVYDIFFKIRTAARKEIGL